MIEVRKSLTVNDHTEPRLSVDDVWAGLQEKAVNPMPYVKSITECTVVDRFDGGLVRDIVHAGHPVREVVTFYPQRLVHFVRTHGSARGTIDNEISEVDGELTLTFSFRIDVDGVEPGSAQEAQFAEAMEADYLDAVRTTLAAVRERVTSGGSAGDAAQPAAPDFVREVFRRVDTFEPPQFAELFAPDGRMVFANGDPMIGPDEIDAGVSGFFQSICGIRHSIVDEWHRGGSSTVELAVSYDRHDVKTVTIPVVSIIHRRGDGLIDDYRVFFDIAPLYA